MRFICVGNYDVVPTVVQYIYVLYLYDTHYIL